MLYLARPFAQPPAQRSLPNIRNSDLQTWRPAAGGSSDRMNVLSPLQRSLHRCEFEKARLGVRPEQHSSERISARYAKLPPYRLTIIPHCLTAKAQYSKTSRKSRYYLKIYFLTLGRIYGTNIG